MSAHCHYCGRPVRTRVFVEATEPEESWGSLAALVNGLTVCEEHAALVLRDPIHHPHMRRWTPPNATDAA